MLKIIIVPDTVQPGNAAGIGAILGGGAIVGLVVGGRRAERMLGHGNFNSRIIVPAVALFAAGPFLGIGIWRQSVWLGLVLMTTGIGLLAAAMASLAGRPAVGRCSANGPAWLYCSPVPAVSSPSSARNWC